MRRHTKRNIWFAAGGLILGATAGLLLAPQSGRRTRALIRDKAVRYSHETVHFGDKKARHLGNKIKGIAHVAKNAIVDKMVRRETMVEEEEAPSI